MGRAPRIDLADHVYHVINRSNGRAQFFHSERDYSDFEYLLNEMREQYAMRILAYVLMPNHWHLLLYPTHDGSLSKSMHWLSTSHAHRHHARMDTVGHGHLYQGRYKSFLIQEDQHLLTVLKYIERNPVRAKLCKNIEAWTWGSGYRRNSSVLKQRALLTDSPVDLPRDYRTWINQAEPSEELESVRLSVNKEVPYAESTWTPGIKLQ